MRRRRGVLAKHRFDGYPRNVTAKSELGEHRGLHQCEQQEASGAISDHAPRQPPT